MTDQAPSPEELAEARELLRQRIPGLDPAWLDTPEGAEAIQVVLRFRAEDAARRRDKEEKP